MLIGHIGFFLSIMTLIISIMAFSYANDAYEVTAFEKKCFRVLLAVTAINILTLALKNYSYLNVLDFIQFGVDCIIFYLFGRLYYILFVKLKRRQLR